MAENRKQRIDDLKQRIRAGETHLVDELAALLAGDEPAPTIRDDEPIRTRRSYTLSPQALAARRANAQKSTGPTTDEGKKSSSRNAWKHGKYAEARIIGLGKPCKSTCPQYPCSLVEDGRCEPGSDCLNKEILVEACRAIEKALLDKDFDSLNSLMVMELGETLQVVRELRGAILEHGAVVESARFDKDGKAIGYELKPHPALLALPNLMKNLGISFTDYNLTPAALEKVKTDKETAATLADIFRGAASSLAQAKQNKGS